MALQLLQEHSNFYTSKALIRLKDEPNKADSKMWILEMLQQKLESTFISTVNI